MSPSLADGRASALSRLVGDRPVAVPRGITSVCSAHPLMIEAALRRGVIEDAAVLIEATCNQVNQEGGYTGMTPSGFRRFVEEIAEQVGFDGRRLIFGGDHLGPNPWRSLPAEAALERAEVMVAAYVEAGFGKLHLDTSMGCAGEPAALDDATTARRAARLAVVAEATAGRLGLAPPVYIVGTEVPPPGGAHESLAHLAVTSPIAAQRTHAVHREAFAAAGLDPAFERVIGLVVQPGVEFGSTAVAIYRPERAAALSAALDHLPGLVFEAHSTDYQPAAALGGLVDDGFAILKVGPGLTFALREALYGLDAIAAVLEADSASGSIQATMEVLMLENPAHWQSHYAGSDAAQRLQRHFSYSDRIRYYWPLPEAARAVDRLFARLGEDAIPEVLISQYLARLYPDVVTGRLAARPRDLCLAAIGKALDPYAWAVSARA
jgi:D-tagatose-bisphosphate aldolase class II non-catalytic subunit